MKFKDYSDKVYTNWVFPDNKTIDNDFEEYKKKELSKWKRRAKDLNARFPLFKDKEHYIQSLKNSPITLLSPSLDNKIQNRSQTSSIEELKKLVLSYKRPRDVDRIFQGFLQHDKIPYPVILKSNNKYFIMSGNTRLDVAFIYGIIPKVIIIDVSK